MIQQNWQSAIVVHQLIPSLSNQQTGSPQQNSGIGATQNPNSQNYLSFLVTPEDAQSKDLETNLQLTFTSNISPTTVTEDESLVAIFPFEIEEPSEVLLIIIADEATKTPIGEINNLLIEINGITVPIKVLVMEATQYQALVGNDWLFKTNAMLDWNTQELQLSQNSQYTQVPVMCGHFKPNNVTSSMLLINFEEKKPKPTWKAYQVLWANIEHNKLPPILDWEEKNNVKGKGTETEKHIWETTINA
ncbi:hypothetical protein G9A89_009541 [Geosiphon pyriformis]|nr:hypothetical protein G9A89_009541 [Geosiphon pyriformis]